MNSYKKIDVDSWKRKMHCMAFRNSVQPQYCVTFNLDVTKFYKTIKNNNWSFTLAMVYAVTKCANEIEEFRYRFLDGEVVLYDRINTSFTYLEKDSELFKVINVPMCDSIGEYISLATKTAWDQEIYFTGPMPNDIYQFSAMPWVSYTHISHTCSGNKDNATPLFDWGKFTQQGDRLIMPFSVQVHHSFVDGIHIGKLENLLQEYINSDLI